MKTKLVPKNDGLTQSRIGDQLQPEEMTPTPPVVLFGLVGAV